MVLIFMSAVTEHFQLTQRILNGLFCLEEFSQNIKEHLKKCIKHFVALEGAKRVLRFYCCCVLS